MLVKRKGRWCVIPETTERIFSCYVRQAEAEKRLRQVEVFKHMKAKRKKR